MDLRLRSVILTKMEHEYPERPEKMSAWQMEGNSFLPKEVKEEYAKSHPTAIRQTGFHEMMNHLNRFVNEAETSCCGSKVSTGDYNHDDRCPCCNKVISWDEKAYDKGLKKFENEYEQKYEKEYALKLEEYNKALNEYKDEVAVKTKEYDKELNRKVKEILVDAINNKKGEEILVYAVKKITDIFEKDNIVPDNDKFNGTHCRPVFDDNCVCTDMKIAHTGKFSGKYDYDARLYAEMDNVTYDISSFEWGYVYGEEGKMPVNEIEHRGEIEIDMSKLFEEINAPDKIKHRQMEKGKRLTEKKLYNNAYKMAKEWTLEEGHEEFANAYNEYCKFVSETEEKYPDIKLEYSPTHITSFMDGGSILNKIIGDKKNMTADYFAVENGFYEGKTSIFGVTREFVVKNFIPSVKYSTFHIADVDTKYCPSTIGFHLPDGEFDKACQNETEPLIKWASVYNISKVTDSDGERLIVKINIPDRYVMLNDVFENIFDYVLEEDEEYNSLGQSYDGGDIDEKEYERSIASLKADLISELTGDTTLIFDDKGNIAANISGEICKDDEFPYEPEELNILKDKIRKMAREYHDEKSLNKFLGKPDNRIKRGV